MGRMGCALNSLIFLQHSIALQRASGRGRTFFNAGLSLHLTKILHMFSMSPKVFRRGGWVLVSLLFSISLQAQVFTDSNLPIVIINTDGNQSIPDDPRVLATMKIIRHEDGSRNYLTDQNNADFLNYNGRISIEIRGSSSQSLDKKGYGFTTLQADNTTNNNVKLLGMPSENDWILNGLAFDPSLIRDYLSYNLSRQMGNYAPRTQYCEVVINGAYNGLYVLQEKIKADSNRVNILKITTTDNTVPNLTGGYITKADKTTGGDPVAWTMSSYAGTTDFIHDLPKPEEVTPQQQSYIKAQFSALALAARTNNTSVVTGYPSVIDVPSFVDFMISNELASNADGYQISTYFHKDRSGKLRAGPVWDFNLTYGNDLFDWGFDRSKTDVWQFSNGDNEGAKFWTDLFNEPTFRCYFSRRWHELTDAGQPLKHSQISDFIDATVSQIAEAAAREQQKWGTVPNLSAEIENLKIFLDLRIDWMTEHLGPFAACSDVVLPSLVICKINYNPGTSPDFPVSNDQEFIEIKNTGTTAANLSGFYFGELGISYQFPANASLAAGTSLFLASNPSVFQAQYGLVAFGQFTRNLSNGSQKLLLADGFGNVVDVVEYDDEAPWPDADGNGNYLQLISTSLDNALASSWTASSNAVLATETTNRDRFVAYPNPVKDQLTIIDTNGITSVRIYTISGQEIYSATTTAKQLTIDCSSFAKGLYLLKVTDRMGTSIQKIIRE